MSFDAIQQLIKDVMGLSPESVGHETIERVVTRRMNSNGVEKVDAYCSLVKNSTEERQSLINEITVPETWFFRDHEPFKALSDYATCLKSKTRQHQIRVLSIPCSTGEEPYSIAMVLRDAGLENRDFKIDAVDISTEVLSKARKGIYRNNSFRGKDMAFRNKYFKEKDGVYAISEEIKKTVTFINQNILEKDFQNDKGPYDVVFCRNLLIYFDLETKCRVLKVLHKLMSKHGLLVLGHAETGRLPEGLFESLKAPGSFAYQKINGANRTVGECTSAFSARAKNVLQAGRNKAFVTSRSGVPAARVKRKLTGEPAPLQEFSDDIDAWIESIQLAADKGDLKAALTECDRLIAEVPDLAQAYYLRGLVLLALDVDEGAYDSFKKAIYLDPKHYQALIHLSVLTEEQGDLRSSETYRARADRLREGGHAVDE